MVETHRVVTSRGVWALWFVLFTFVLVAGGAAYHRHERARIRDEKYGELAAIAELKAGEIQHWQQDRLAFAHRVVSSPFFRRALADWLRNPTNQDLQADIQERLKLDQTDGAYADVLLLDTEGHTLLSVLPEPKPLELTGKRAVEEAIADRTPVLSDLYRCGCGRIHLDAVAPVLDPQGRPMAVVVLRSNADDALYPLIESWPTPSRTAETLLVEVEGDSVLFLNTLRHEPGAALSLRQPLTQTDLPAVQAALGKQGMFEGRDYRGMPVLADLRTIPGSPWFMVAKVDEDEILSEAQYRAGVIALFVVLCIVLAASATAYGYRQRQVRLFRGLYRAEREQREAQEEFRTTLYSIGDAVITTDANGAIKQMNPVAERLTGWKEAEARGKPLEEVFHIINQETRATAENPVQRVLREGLAVGLANDTMLVARDGVERPIADSGAPIRDETGTIIGVVLVFRDQTEECAAYTALRTSLARQEALLAAVPEIIVEVDRNKVYVWANLAGYEFFGQDVIGKEAGHYFEGEQDTDAAVQPLFDGDENVVYLESWQRRKDGQKRLLAWWCRVLKDDQGNVTGALSSARDITEREQVEEALRESEERYCDLVENSQDLICTHDLEGNVLSTNEAGVRFTGYSREALLRMNTAELLAPDVRDQFAAYLSEIQAQGQASGLMRIRTAGGETRYWEYNSTLRREGVAAPIVRGMAHDITERLRAHKELEAARKDWEAIFHGIPHPTIVMDSEHSILVGNKRLEQLPGKGLSEYQHLKCWEIFHGPDAEGPPAGCPFERMKGSGGIETVEMEMEAFGGVYLVSCTPMLDSQGQLDRVIHIATDITALKAHEREIERLTRLYATLSQVNEGLVRVRSREELFQEVCRITAEFAGFKVVWIGWHDRETHAVVPVGRGGDREGYVNTIEVFADERPEGRGPVGTCIRENKTCIVQDFANDPRTAPWHAPARAHGLRAAAAFPLHLNGEVCGAFTVYTGEANVFRDKEVALLEEIAEDISFALEHLEQEEERRKLESQLRQAQKMEAIGRLAGGVAHDFNNMLNVILGYTEMALTKVGPRDPLRRDLDEIQGAAKRSADLTRQLLAFSRRQTIAPRVLDLSAQLKGMERLLQRIIGEDIDLEFMLSPDPWPVHVDPSQVDQLVANLAINSRDAMPDGGRLTVETGNVTLDEAHCETHVGFVPGDFVLLAISDSGCGMEPETLDHVFEPFFTTKGEGKGTGLGLATVYGIVKQNNGFVNIYSEPGQGATVKIYLPRHLGDERAAPAEIRSPAPLGGPCVPAGGPCVPAGGHETVLLVEDQEQVRVLAKLMLERLGYTVLEAATPADAVAQSETFQGEVHLLLTDVVMPDMNGRELADRIRAIRPGIRTLFVSGYTAAAIAHRGVLDAGIHFLQKPFSLDVLARKTREALDR